MGRNTFNWWRRNKKRKTLPKSKPLIERIRNGDFEVSQYLVEAEYEMSIKKELEKEEKEKGRRFKMKHETIRQNVFDKTDQYQRRYNRLMKDFWEDEDRILQELHVAFRKEFGETLPHLYKRWLDGKEPDMNIEELYNKCLELKSKGYRYTRRKNNRKKGKGGVSLPQVIKGEDYQNNDAF